MRDGTAKWLSALHRSMYATTSGLIGRRLVGNDMLLLTTVGRSTGRLHTVPLLYLIDACTDVRSYVVIASWGGRDHDPHWYSNLVANPAVEIRIRGRTFAASAAPLAEPERSRWWQRAVKAYPGYQRYQARTTRLIPLVRLSTRCSGLGA